MATRMQQRRGTAAQWTAANPTLNAGELGWESDTNKFKIGDGTNGWSSLDYFADINSTANPAFGSSITFEGATANDYETILAVTDPTADNTITFPDATGTVTLLTATQTLTNKSISLGSNTVTSTLAQLNTAISDADVASLAGTETLTNKTLTSPTLTTPNIGVASGTSLTLTGDLTVQGTTTTIESTTLAVDDKNITLGDVATPSDVTADGGGITLKGATDKTFNWVDATDAWTSSEHINLASGKAFYLNGTLATAATQTLTNKTIDGASNTLTVRLGNDISGFGTGVATFLATPSSANWASMLTDEIGTGNVLLSDMATSAQSASYTLVLTDKAKVVEMSNASANNLTVPANADVAFPVGTQIHIVQTGAGQTTVVAAATVTINSATTLKIRAQWGAATLIKRATNTWVLVGDLATS